MSLGLSLDPLMSKNVEASRISDADRDLKSLREKMWKFGHKIDGYLQEIRQLETGPRHSFDEAKLDGRHLGRDLPRTTLGEVSDGSLEAKFARRNEVKLLIFDGSSQKVDFLDWIDTLEDYFQATNPPDAVKCKLATSKLRGEARTWWNELQNSRFSKGKNLITSWSRMSDLLHERFLNTSRLTWWYKQENEGDEKHANCLMKCPLESYGSSQSEKCEHKIGHGLCQPTPVNGTEAPMVAEDILKLVEERENNIKKLNEDDGLDEGLDEEQSTKESSEYLMPARCSTEDPCESSISKKATMSDLDTSTGRNISETLKKTSHKPSIDSERIAGHHVNEVHKISCMVSSVFMDKIIATDHKAQANHVVNEKHSSNTSKIGNESGLKVLRVEREQNRRQALLRNDVDILEDEMLMLSFDPGGVTKRGSTFIPMLSNVESADLSSTEEFLISDSSIADVRNVVRCGNDPLVVLKYDAAVERKVVGTKFVTSSLHTTCSMQYSTPIVAYLKKKWYKDPLPKQELLHEYLSQHFAVLDKLAAEDAPEDDMLGNNNQTLSSETLIVNFDPGGKLRHRLDKKAGQRHLECVTSTNSSKLVLKIGLVCLDNNKLHCMYDFMQFMAMMLLQSRDRNGGNHQRRLSMSVVFSIWLAVARNSVFCSQNLETWMQVALGVEQNPIYARNGDESGHAYIVSIVKDGPHHRRIHFKPKLIEMQLVKRLVLLFDPGGQGQRHVKMGEGLGHMVHQVTPLKCSNISITSEKHSRVSLAFNRVIDMYDFKVCCWFNSTVMWCCFNLQLGSNVFPLLTSLAHVPNFVELVDSRTLQAVRITNVLIDMEYIPVLVIIGGFNVPSYELRVKYNNEGNIIFMEIRSFVALLVGNSAIAIEAKPYFSGMAEITWTDASKLLTVSLGDYLLVDLLMLGNALFLFDPGGFIRSIIHITFRLYNHLFYTRVVHIKCYTFELSTHRSTTPLVQVAEWVTSLTNISAAKFGPYTFNTVHIYLLYQCLGDMVQKIGLILEYDDWKGLKLILGWVAVLDLYLCSQLGKNHPSSNMVANKLKRYASVAISTDTCVVVIPTSDVQVDFSTLALNVYAGRFGVTSATDGMTFNGFTQGRSQMENEPYDVTILPLLGVLAEERRPRDALNFLTRGRVILREDWNYLGKFSVTKPSAVSFSPCSGYLNVPCTVARVRLFHKVVNGLDPPTYMKVGWMASAWILLKVRSWTSFSEQGDGMM